MKQIFCLITILIISCQGYISAQEKDKSVSIEVEADSVDYELIIIDSGFESWLAMQKPAEFYSNDYYQSWNQRYVNEWNALYSSGMDRHPEIESYIDYRPGTVYDIDLNYRLYYYFLFFEKKNSITLIHRR